MVLQVSFEIIGKYGFIIIKITNYTFPENVT